MKIKNPVVLCAALVFALACVLSAPQAAGQAVYGSVFGTITDPSGAAVPGAKVTVTSATKGTVNETTTNSDGNYSVTHLIPDLYNIRAEGSGFKAFELKNISVSADAGSRVDGQFQVGGSTETVEVTGEAPQLKTDRADVATTFNDKYVEDVPILNRNFTTLQLMAPGSQKAGGLEPRRHREPAGQPADFYPGTALQRHRLRTGRNRQPGSDPRNHRRESQPRRRYRSQRSRCRITTRSSAKQWPSVVTAQTKSGSNEFHGSGFWFRRTDATAGARSLHPVSKRSAHRTLYSDRSRGSSLAAPSAARSSRTSCSSFGDYQGTRQTNGVSGTFTVPTNQVRKAATRHNGASSTPGSVI